MAHTITGIDLGSHTVKFAVIEVGFRSSRLASTFEELVPPGEAPLPERQALALAAGLAKISPEQSFFTAVPGDQIAVRVLDLPFSDPRKIDQVVAFELEGQIVNALDDVVFDHVLVPVPSAEGSTVLAVAARIDEVTTLLANLKASGVDPHALYAAPVVYQALFGQKAPTEGTLPSCKLLIDIGHERTNLCFLQNGKTTFARTLRRGGAGLTAAIARAFQCDEARALFIKHEQGMVASAKVPSASPAEARMDALLREELGPLLRDIRQTLASARARSKVPIDSVLLTGGTADLRGLPEYLSEALEVPVETWAPVESSSGPDVAPFDDSIGPAGGTPRFALATAIAWRGARGEREIDLRRGPFVFKANFSVLRQKAGHLAALAAAVLLCVTIDATMSMSRLSSEEEKLRTELKVATTELFGVPRLDGKEVTRELRKNWKDEMVPFPKATAFDVLNELSRRTPGPDIKLDVELLKIEPKKILFNGTIASVTALDELEKKFMEWTDCVEKIDRGGLSEVTGGKRFKLTISSQCP